MRWTETGSNGLVGMLHMRFHGFENSPVAGDLEARRRAVRSRRGLRHWTDPSGTWHLAAQGLPEDGARVMASLAPFAGAAFKSARREGRREAQEAYAFDGLVALAGAGGGHKPRYDISVRVDLESLLRGYPLGGELCELVGYGTISAQAACDMVASGNGLLRAVLTKGRYVTGVAHPGRRATSHVATALDFVFPAAPPRAAGCGPRTSRPTTASSGPSPVSRCSTCWTGSAPATTR